MLDQHIGLARCRVRGAEEGGGRPLPHYGDGVPRRGLVPDRVPCFIDQCAAWPDSCGTLNSSSAAVCMRVCSCVLCTCALCVRLCLCICAYVPMRVHFCILCPLVVGMHTARMKAQRLCVISGPEQPYPRPQRRGSAGGVRGAGAQGQAVRVLPHQLHAGPCRACGGAHGCGARPRGPGAGGRSPHPGPDPRRLGHCRWGSCILNGAGDMCTANAGEDMQQQKRMQGWAVPEKGRPCKFTSFYFEAFSVGVFYLFPPLLFPFSWFLLLSFHITFQDYSRIEVHWNPRPIFWLPVVLCVMIGPAS